jgi:hypothetical protein
MVGEKDLVPPDLDFRPNGARTREWSPFREKSAVRAGAERARPRAGFARPTTSPPQRPRQGEAGRGACPPPPR